MRCVSGALLLLLSLTAAEARECKAVDGDVRAALDAKAYDRLAPLYRQAQAACDAAWTEALGDDIAKAQVDRFFDAVGEAQGDSDLVAQNLSLLTDAKSFGSPWQLLLTLAEVDFDRKDYDAAAPLYQEAMNRMSAVAARSDAEADALPDIADFKAIHARMSEAVLLAQTYEAPPVRRGEPEDGLYTGSWRGYVVKAVPVPVQFAFGTTDFTDKGLKAATHLARYLATSGLNHVTLVGHTDPVGSDKDNKVLSQKRAEALRDFVAKSGYKGSIDVIGKGESEPFVPDDATRFASDRDAQYALDRRVELLR
ncbi:OmpA family protein [Oryzibacter oryziterrae]|uniref:OmpA family protein n=1 Tax=Oryzibacter oryziterrae TaxID=2766474 RepID=UPI001F39342F|nr:OmpA family protein [Oryzibacter oryziterrae]